MKNFTLLLSFIALSYFTNAQCNVTFSSTTDATCWSMCNGTAVANPSGGTPPYTYAWSPGGQTTQTVTGLCAGSYTCSVTDQVGCTTQSSVAISEPTVLTSVVQTLTNVSCFNGNNGSATVTPGGGSPAYTYQWSPVGGTSQSASGLVAGTYTVSVTDAHGCLSTSTTVITQPPALTTNASTVSSVSCYGMCDGIGTVMSGGGTPPYSYAWTPIGGSGATASNLCVGYYTVLVTDGNGCTHATGMFLTQPSPLLLDICNYTNATCGNSDGTATVCDSGGVPPYTFLWSTGATTATITGLATGVYNCTETDANGCTAVISVSINDGVTTNVTSYSNVSCSSCCDGSISVSASGGAPPYTYLWSPGGQTGDTATGLCTGTYTCTVTDANGCSGIIVHTITDLYSICGTVYFDANQNGVRDIGEPPLSNHQVQLMPVNTIAFTDGNGNYCIYAHAGSYNLSYLPPSGFTQTSAPLTYSVTIPPAQANLDFGAYSPSGLYSSTFYVYHHAMRCAPSHGYSSFNIQNTGYFPISGSVTMVHSSNLSLFSSSIPPDVISGDTVIWYYTNLLMSQSLYSNIVFNDPAAGNTVWYTMVDSMFDSGGNPVTQYTDSFGFLVTCSCDPNDKEVNPMGELAQHFTSMNSELTYTINFQNTGNDTAFNVVVIDTLDANLNLNSFRLLNSSHPVSAELLTNRVMRFTFANIQLPDSIVDLEGSNGYVGFSIKPNASLPDPTVINNTAHIFFDSNAPVATNTAYNTLSDIWLGVNGISLAAESVTIFPNPFHYSATILINEEVSILNAELVIYDMLGNEIQRSQISNHKSEIRNLTSGMYLLNVEGLKDNVIKKLIVY